MREPGRIKRIAVIVGAVMLLAVGLLAASIYAGRVEKQRQAEQKRVAAEEDRLKGLDLTERIDQSLGRPSSLTAAEQEELRQLRERAAKRRIERGY